MPKPPRLPPPPPPQQPPPQQPPPQPKPSLRIGSPDLKINPSIPSKGKLPSSTNLQQKETQNKSWQQKYHRHGSSWDIIADVQNEIHGCINSSVSEEIDIYLSNLHFIATQADEILQESLLKISSKEQQEINRLVQARQNIINDLIKDGRTQMNQTETYYRKQIEDFIDKLQTETAGYIDLLQKQVEAKKQDVFSHSNINLEELTMKSETAKTKLLQRLQASTHKKREEVLHQTINMSNHKTSQSLGYEQLRKVNLELYSTVGIKEDGQGYNNIPNRDKYDKEIKAAKKEIKDTKANNLPKRTVYVGNNDDATLESRNQTE
ncbi:unnamed protein product [Rotaria sordida]|uniref:Uncharacterized protein n=2 Tax=Rotaria sordida TaxID=392033 RepID=A0A814F7R4_9BILA|nr:unnamed protein product [Rotaria sordida]